MNSHIMCEVTRREAGCWSVLYLWQGLAVWARAGWHLTLFLLHLLAQRPRNLLKTACPVFSCD